MWNRYWILVLLLGCSTSSKDPLKNTKKLVKEGHATLYQNGAFTVPSTKIKLVPPGPDFIGLAKEMLGLRSKESFLKYIGEVKDSVVVIYENGKATYQLAKYVEKDVYNSLSQLAPEIKKSSTIVMDKTLAATKHILGQSWNSGKNVYKKTANAGKNIADTASKVDVNYSPYKGWEKFIQGLVIIPEKMDQRKKKIKAAISVENFSENFEKTEEYRKKYSDHTTYLIKDAFRDYDENVGKKLSRVDNELEKSSDFGVSLAVIKSVRWLLDAILWEGMIKPIGKFSAGAIGYTLVNGVAYPIYLVTKNGVTVSHVAVEVLMESGKGVYEITAPTANLAISALLYSGDALIKESVEKTTYVTGFLLGNSVRYIVAPMAAATVSTVTATGGVAVGIGGSALAGSTRVAGEGLGVSSKVISLTTASVTYAGGTSYNISKGAAEVAYEVVKASVVPPSLVLGSGITLSYGTLSQLSAQAVLAVADSAYLVLSMEGPSWVIYAVSGKLGDDDIPAGTVIDLEKMKSEGEEIRKVPVSEEDIKNIIEEL